MLGYQGMLGERGYPRTARAVAGIQHCFGAACPVSASAGGAGGGATGQMCSWGGWGHPSLRTCLWVSAAADLPRQAARMALLTLAIGWQVTRERYSPCPGVRSFSILLPLCRLIDAIKLPEQLQNKCLSNRRGLWEKPACHITAQAQQARGLEVICA